MVSSRSFFVDADIHLFPTFLYTYMELLEHFQVCERCGKNLLASQHVGSPGSNPMEFLCVANASYLWLRQVQRAMFGFEHQALYSFLLKKNM